MPMAEPPRDTADQVTELTDDIAVDLTGIDNWKDASRYRRQSGALPRLADDPDYSSDNDALPHPSEEPAGFMAKLRAKIGR